MQRGANVRPAPLEEEPPAEEPAPSPEPKQPETAGPAEPEEGEPAEGREPRPPDEVLEDILREVQHVARNQEYEEFSVWNIFGGLVQILVFFLLAWNFFAHRVDLMLAVVLQLVALTFFVLAKK